MKAIHYSVPCAVVALGFLNAQVEAQTPLGSAWTYQGHLEQSGEPVTGAIGLSFSLFDSEAEGQGVGDPILFDGSEGGLPLVQVMGGLLSVKLDFGSGAFDGNARWLEIGVLTPAGDYTILSPRQAVSPVPYALHVNGLAMDEAGVLHATGDIQTDGTVAAGAFASNSPLVLEAPENTERARIDDITGHFGIGTTNPRARLHVSDTSLGVLESALAGDSIVIEDGDAVLGLYSDAGGISGSAISLAEVSGFGTLTDKWTMGRGPVPGSNSLFFSFGPSAAYLQNTTMMTIQENGYLGLGTSLPARRLDIAGTGAGARITNSTMAGSHLELKGTATGLSFSLGSLDFVDVDDNRAGGISYTRSLLGDRLVLSAGGADAVYIDGSGNVGVGTVVPKSPIHVEGGSDVTLSGGGFLTVGSTAGANIAIDNNEIMSRNNGSPAALLLNKDGGGVRVGGLLDARDDAVVRGELDVQGILDIGIETVFAICLGWDCSVSCPAGKATLTGGCRMNSFSVSAPYPCGIDFGSPFECTTAEGGSAPSGWYCRAGDDGGNVGAWAVCARIK